MPGVSGSRWFIFLLCESKRLVYVLDGALAVMGAGHLEQGVWLLYGASAKKSGTTTTNDLWGRGD